MPTPEESHPEAKLLQFASKYIGDKVVQGAKKDDKIYPLNRGDIVLLVMLIEQGMPTASSKWTDPLNLKRLTAIRGKLGNFAIDAPQMSKEEAQQFRD